MVLKTHTGAYIDVEGTAVKARYGLVEDPPGARVRYKAEQRLTIEKDGDGAVYDGDTVFLRAHTGKTIDVEGTAVQARWDDPEASQERQQALTIEKAGGGAVYDGDTVYLKAHTGKHIEAFGMPLESQDDQYQAGGGTIVRARDDHQGDWMALTIEVPGLASGVVDCPDGDIGWEGVFMRRGYKDGSDIPYCAAWDGEDAMLGMQQCTYDQEICTKVAARHLHLMGKSFGVLMLKRMMCDDEGCSLSSRCVRNGFSHSCRQWVDGQWPHSLLCGSQAGKCFDVGEDVFSDIDNSQNPNLAWDTSSQQQRRKK